MATGGTYINSVAQLLAYGDAAGSRLHGTSESTYANITSISYNEVIGAQQVTSYGDSKWIDPLVIALKKCGITCVNNGHYDSQMKDAISAFQRQYLSEDISSRLVTLGVLNDATVKAIFDTANANCQDVIQEDPDSGQDISGRDVSDSPHYQSFFKEDNAKQFRKNHKDIKIVFGNSGIVKTLHDVVMRSVGVEVDTSGNPISEVYEFIARDVTESDESKDVGKYENDVGTAPSDIQYKFNFHTD